MNRLLVTLLLLASLWPVVAGAGAEVRVQDGIAPLTAGSAAEAVRIEGGIELVSSLERSGTGERSTSSTLFLQSGAEFPRRQALRLASAEALGRQGVVLPRPAHLSYFANAPPRRW